MIASLHVATGAVAGAALGSRARAAAVAPLLHFALDIVPHEDIDSHRFELATAGAALAALALVRGTFDPATIGAALSAAPDLEHLRRFPRPGGRKVFPSHWLPGRSRGPRVPVWFQLAAAGVLLTAVLRRS
jgi:hypothetical protein